MVILAGLVEAGDAMHGFDIVPAVVAALLVLAGASIIFVSTKYRP